MLDIFLIVNIALIVVLAILIYKNKCWKNQKVIVVIFAIILIVFGLTLIFS